jgi:hypothetical protein
MLEGDSAPEIEHRRSKIEHPYEWHPEHDDEEQVPHPPPPLPTELLKDPPAPAIFAPKRESFFRTLSPPQSGQVTFFFSSIDRKRTSNTLLHGSHTNS